MARRDKGLRGARRLINAGTSSIHNYKQAASKIASAIDYINYANKLKAEYRKITNNALRTIKQESIDSITNALNSFIGEIEIYFSHSQYKYGTQGKVFGLSSVNAKRDIDNSLIGLLRLDLSDTFKGLTNDNELSKIVFSDSAVMSVMYDILREAKDLAPIDKRYVGNYMTGKGRAGKIRKITIAMPILQSSDRYSLRTLRETIGFGRYKVKEFSIGGEDTSLSKEKQRFIQRMGKENRRLLWYNANNDTIMATRKKLDPKKMIPQRDSIVATPFKGEEANVVHGGEEELRRSGEYFEKEGMISFNPQRYGTKYDYSLIQHNNTSYKHIAGKTSFFLLKAYSRNKKRLIDAIRSAIGGK